ncbi:MAG: hypothetical protein IAE99_07935 [Rhodothermales bacterium]|nr:hypothetical protein [Rhodothermales bacterium]
MPTARPMPPAHLASPYAAGVAPAPDVAEWARKAFVLPGGPLHNPDHAHLYEAHIAALWVADPFTRRQRSILADARLGRLSGDAWAQAERRALYAAWFGGVPDFVIRLYAPFWAACSDADACALVEHELYHCAQDLDPFGAPRFTKDGRPIYALQGHDVEEFVGVTRRYGPGAIDGSVSRLVDAALDPSGRVATSSIAAACGTCLVR